ncbi:MAG: AzlC family ABC transporter permease [Coriobacteriales bacterium]|nr:AzlC family ABC transporter permease [Coriobacteriales bacterium]
MMPLVPAGVSFGLVVGAAVTQVGLGLAESVGMSTLVYGASAQLAATGLWREGAPLVVVVLTALVINSRFFIYSASLAPVLKPASWYSALGLAYFVRDGAYAATVTKAVPDAEVDDVAYYLGASTFDWAVWLVSTTAGALGAALIPTSWSLDFVVPLVFVALLAGALDSRLAVESAVVSAVSAFILIPLLPMQSGLLVAIVGGMAWGAVREMARGPEATS